MFSRTILAISLGCAMSSVAFAENAPATGSSPRIQNYALSQSTSAPVAASAPAATSAPVAQSSGNPAPASDDASAVDTTPTDSTKVDSAESPSTPTPVEQPTSTPTNSSPTASATGWSLNALNNATWSNNLQRGQLPVYAKAQVLLNRKHASPGAIDGATGKNTLKAISAYQTMNGLTATGNLDEATWQSLNSGENTPVFEEYTITAADLKGPYANAIPSNYADQAKMKGLYYTRVTEMLGEKFHMDETFLKKLNPKATFNKVGEKIIVANVRNNLPEDIHLIIAHKGAKQLYLFNSKNKMIASFPATIGSTDTPSPAGTYTVKNIAPNPWYGYNPKNFIQGGNTKPLSLPPGPNNPVGNMWIGLSKPSFGIHGTPNPSLISKTASHGCIRLTNWDAGDLAKRVKPGVTVKFLE
ncbi:L,D-transpeptidase family protein [Acinetobacter qingfengensis]|uniref:Peptidase n=1 Tax=Acinetobacter qingfengensis TaxID=1262585 RepID=A0A1E7R767_9GAMM|nr:L,D-transpeptidase [Acinetobacter qingfengensis]KAA8734427.1 L,D-transpeptidase family protein [Acinetobacter qingfengensis]OEY95152.1 peptidase [Acinetobacter qingfengensis]